MLTIYSFIAQLLRSYGIWFLVYLEFVGSCQCLLLGFLLSGKGRFGRHCNGDIWKVVPLCLMWCIWKERNCRCFEYIERSMPDLKLLFFQTLLDWFSVWRNQPFSSILDLLDFCNVRFWFVHPCILLVYLGASLFLVSMNLYYLSKKLKVK